MNSNNSWQRMGQFARFPRHDLSSVSQPPAGELFPVGQMMEGGGIPAPAMMSQQQAPRQQDYGEGQPPTGKKILGMPKDRFIALMGSIAQAFGGDSPSGRMGAGLINMADIMHRERMGQAETRAAETKARREAATKERERKEKIPSGWEAFYNERKETGQTAEQIWTDFKRIGKKEPAPKTRTGTKTIDGINYIGLWDDKGNFIPQRKLTKSEEVKRGLKPKPPAGEKPKEMTYSEKRAQRKELRGLHETILGVDPKTGTPNIEYPEVQISIDSWNELSDKPFVYKRTSGTPKEERSGFLGIDILKPDVKATPATLEEIPISQFKTPEEIMGADYLSERAKRRLLLKRFPKKFE